MVNSESWATVVKSESWATVMKRRVLGYYGEE